MIIVNIKFKSQSAIILPRCSQEF